MHWLNSGRRCPCRRARGQVRHCQRARTPRRGVDERLRAVPPASRIVIFAWGRRGAQSKPDDNVLDSELGACERPTIVSFTSCTAGASASRPPTMSVATSSAPLAPALSRRPPARLCRQSTRLAELPVFPCAIGYFTSRGTRTWPRHRPIPRREAGMDLTARGERMYCSELRTSGHWPLRW